MQPFTVFYAIFGFLLVPSVLTTLSLYFYPVLFQCDFPRPSRPGDRHGPEYCLFEDDTVETPAPLPTGPPLPRTAPFRLIVFADPQLEGDTSLPDADAPLFPSLENLKGLSVQQPWHATQEVLVSTSKSFFTEDVVRILQGWRKRLDLLGNDFFLAHIYRSLFWYLKPTHSTVLGDLLGSQWITDKEFERRSNRLWRRVFSGAKHVPDEIMYSAEETVHSINDPQWPRRLINIAGNHDIGYGGDITEHRVERFEKAFGRVNWSSRFTLDQTNLTYEVAPSLRIVVLNTMNLDTPVQTQQLQDDTYGFLNNVIATSDPVEDRHTATVLLTHIPLYKPDGVCIDGAMWNFGENGIREQNHLSDHVSKSILEGIYGMRDDLDEPPNYGRGRNGVILTGHDHEGCDVYHHLSDEDTEDTRSEKAVHYPWTATRWWRAEKNEAADDAIPGIREITVRSMMGSYGGNVGLLSGWFDEVKGEWVFGFDNCDLLVQHVWWGIHILDAIVIGSLLLGVASEVKYELEKRKKEKEAAAAKKDQTDPKDKGVVQTQKKVTSNGTVQRKAEKND